MRTPTNSSMCERAFTLVNCIKHCTSKLAQTAHSFIRGTDITVRCAKPCLDFHDMLTTIVVHVGQPRRPELVGSMGQ